jgi:hypothetical protein
MFGYASRRLSPSPTRRTHRFAQDKRPTLDRHFRLAFKAQLGQQGLGDNNAMRVANLPNDCFHGFHRANNVITVGALGQINTRSSSWADDPAAICDDVHGQLHSLAFSGTTLHGKHL